MPVLLSKWLQSVGSDRETRCRSDSYLRRSDNSPPQRQLTRSEPGMAYTRDVDGFMVPQVPASIGPRSYRADVDTGSIEPPDITLPRVAQIHHFLVGALLRTRFTAVENLAVNGISMPIYSLTQHRWTTSNVPTDNRWPRMPFQVRDPS